MFAFILNEKQAYAKPLAKVLPTEHVAGVYQSLKHAANAASKHAKYYGLKYISATKAS